MTKPLATALAALLLGATPALAGVFNINLVNDEKLRRCVDRDRYERREPAGRYGRQHRWRPADPRQYQRR